MDLEVVIDEPWQHILRAIRRQEGRTAAAIAYVTKRLLDLAAAMFSCVMPRS
jgi:hypothetical protein